MKLFVTVFTLLGVVIALNAADIPLDPYSDIPLSKSHTHNPPTEDLLDMKVALPIGVENQPVYYFLETLTLEKKQNATIGIEFMMPVSKNVEMFAQEIEQLWNSGYFDEALELFAELNEMEGVKGNALIGINWRTPIPAPLSDWADDVLISARDSVFVLAMDHSLTNDNLYAIIGFTGDGNGSKFAVNLSDNGGATWVETYALYGFNYVMNDLDGCFVGDHFYVAYTGGLPANPNTMAWLKRFKAADAEQDTFPNGDNSYNILDTIEIVDIDISSNHEEFDNRLYFYCIDNAGIIHNYWNDLITVAWAEIATDIDDAQQGLDTDWNYNFTNYSSLLSYINNADQVKIYGRAGNAWDLLFAYGILNTPFDYFTTGIGGYDDTLFCAFSYDGVHKQVRYLVQYDTSGSWYFGYVAPDTSENNWTPDVTLRGGGGIHAVYRGPSISAGYYRYRGYHTPWSTPEQFNDHSMSGAVRPQIEYVGSSAYGILYRRPMVAYGTCYFGRSDWTAVEEEPGYEPVAGLISLAPNPSNGIANLSYVVKTEGIVQISVFDVAGRLVKNLVNETKQPGEHSYSINNQNLAAGIYFIRAATPDGVNTQPMTIIRLQ